MSIFHQSDTEGSLLKILEKEIVYNPVLSVDLYLELEKEFFVN